MNWGTSWADKHIENLRAGLTVQFRPHGNSMTPKIKSGQLVTVVPIGADVQVDDIVLCRVGTKQYVHLVKAVVRASDAPRAEECASSMAPTEVLIGNNHGKTNGWIPFKQVYGVVASVDP